MPCPTKEELVKYLADSSNPQTKREITAAFKVKGAEERTALKGLLRELDKEGILVKQSGAYGVPDSLPTVGTIEVTEITVDGDTIAKPVGWNEDLQGPAPRIEVRPDKKGHPALTVGDRVYAKLNKYKNGQYGAKTIKKLDTPQNKVVGVVKRTGNHYKLTPADKKAKYDYDIPLSELGEAKEGDVAVAEVQPGRGPQNRQVRITQIISNENDIKAISTLSAHEAGLHTEFTQAAIDETKNMKVPDLKGREDLRKIPLVTIDGADARDFDDAVFSEDWVDANGKELGSYILVAIADVAHYVRPGSALDKEAFQRGNSTYFPDMVIPMLPEKLSNDLCSLRPNENRACMHVHMWIDKQGQLQKFKFGRGLMKSAARLTYDQVQAAKDGITDDKTGPLMENVIEPLYKAYEVLKKASESRNKLDLDLPEKQIVINEDGKMTGVKVRERYDSHKLIEEFMVLANVAAAKALNEKGRLGVFRVHDKPSAEKLESAGEVLETMGLSLPKGQVTGPKQLNEILKKAAELPFGDLAKQIILRAQAQAHYHTEDTGHFGLALRNYTHFTSPIRRYSDLIVHRGLIDSFNLGAGGMSEDQKSTLQQAAEHISSTERISMEAERNAVDRFAAEFMSQQVGATFSGRINGVTRFGLFVSLDGTGAEGLLHFKSLPNDYYVHNEQQHALIGRDHGRIYRLGARMDVRVTGADKVSGELSLEAVNDLGADIPGLAMPELPKSSRNHRKTGPRRQHKYPRGKKGGKGSGPRR